MMTTFIEEYQDDLRGLSLVLSCVCRDLRNIKCDFLCPVENMDLGFMGIFDSIII